MTTNAPLTVFVERAFGGYSDRSIDIASGTTFLSEIGALNLLVARCATVQQGYFGVVPNGAPAVIACAGSRADDAHPRDGRTGEGGSRRTAASQRRSVA